MIPNDLAKKYQKMLDTPMCVVAQSGSGDCQGEIIRSHAPQKRVILESIAEDGHVMGVIGKKFMRMQGENKAFENGLSAEIIGINFASTFRGFCKKHDNDIFRPIEFEKREVSCKYHAFLHCYRAICREFYKKKIMALQVVETLKDAKQRKKSPGLIDYMEMYAYEANEGYKSMLSVKKQYDHILSNPETIDRFSYYAQVYDGIPNIVSLGSFLPLMDANGTELDNDPNKSDGYNIISFATTWRQNGFANIWGWIDNHARIGNVFSKSLSGLDTELDVIGVILVLLENTFWRPSWWKRLPDLVKIELLEKLGVGGVTSNLTSDTYKMYYPDSEYHLNSVLTAKGYGLFNEV